MRSMCFTLLVLCTSCIAVAQKSERKAPFEEIKDGDYTIRLIPSPGGTYGYDILKGKLVMVHQPFNPFPPNLKRGSGSELQGRGLPPGMEGLKSKQDALKVAKYLVKQAKNNRGIPAGRLSQKLAKDLNIMQ